MLQVGPWRVRGSKPGIVQKCWIDGKATTERGKDEEVEREHHLKPAVANLGHYCERKGCIGQIPSDSEILRRAFEWNDQKVADFAEAGGSQKQIIINHNQPVKHWFELFEKPASAEFGCRKTWELSSSEWIQDWGRIKDSSVVGIVALVERERGREWKDNWLSLDKVEGLL